MMLAAMLSACGSSATPVPATGQPAPTIAAAQPTAAPTAPPPTTVLPTALPEPTAAPTVIPESTVAPQTGVVLPAPLLYTANEQGGVNQIWRLERDGTTRTMLLEEPPAQDKLVIVE